MKVAYLILAHANPAHLGRMAAALSSDESSVFVHIDEKADLAKFRNLDGLVRFTSRRLPVYWGEFSMVEAILVLMEDALHAGDRYDYLVLLSGADYPIRSRRYIHDFLARYAGTEFISVAAIPAAEAGIALSKVNRMAVPSKRPMLKLLVKAAAKLGLARRDYRRYLGNLQPYGGSTWWALTRGACEHILEFAAANRWFCRFFEYTLSSDEMFFHTILGNSRFKARIQRSPMYDDWSAGGVHPKIITEAHVALFERQPQVALADAFGPGELLFARKFSDSSSDLVDRVDEMIARKDQLSTAE
jgi:hypothetical protein